jgi:hypothetical protein
MEQHVRAAHDMTARAYYRRFPNDDLTCDEIRAAQFARSNGVDRLQVPHWEPLWTRAYILDRLAWLHKLGLPLNSTAVLAEEPRLYRRALHYFPDWDTVLSALGIEPDKARLAAARREWTRDSVIKALCNRVLTARPVNRAGVRADQPSLEYAAERLFGSFNRALKAAGLDAQEIRDKAAWQGKYTTRRTVIDAILDRHRAGLPLNDRGVSRGPHGDTALYSKARRMFGSWRAAVVAAHLDYDRVVSGAS